jgi:hypothetical protein
MLFDNSGPSPHLIALEELGELRVIDEERFAKIREATKR